MEGFDEIRQSVDDDVDEQLAGMRDLFRIITTRNRMAPCECGHTKKHHKQSGRCRKGCNCDYAMRKVERKRRRNSNA